MSDAVIDALFEASTLEEQQAAFGKFPTELQQTLK